MSRVRRQRGFSLLEMMVVLVIIAIGITLAVPMIEGGYDSREVRRAARQIVSTLHHSRNEAIATGAVQEVVIDPVRNSIATTEWGRWAVLTDRAVIERVQGGAPVGDGATQLLFFPNGSSSGVELVVASRRDRSTNRVRVSMDPLVGTVMVEDDVQ